MTTQNMKEILRVAQINHKFLLKKLNSKEGKKLAGNWVAVAKKKIFVDSAFRKALDKAKKSTFSLRF